MFLFLNAEVIVSGRGGSCSGTVRGLEGAMNGSWLASSKGDSATNYLVRSVA